MAQLQQVKEKEVLEPHEAQHKVVYFIIKIEYVPKPSKRKSLNKKIKNE